MGARRTYGKAFAIIATSACVLFAAEPPVRPPTAWRAGWLSSAPAGELDAIIASTADLRFHALVFSAPSDRMPDIARQIRRAGLEAYCWFGMQLPSENGAAYRQVLSEEEQEAYRALMQDEQRYAHGYQSGGEPLPGHVDVWEGPLACFHHAEVRQATIAKLRAIVQACPELTGIALDGFGYQNLHDCRCEESQRQARTYQAAHPQLDVAAAEERFFFETLVAFQNEIATEARRLRPDIKLANHVWPSYEPDRLYGKHLDIDYCSQTTAWFFKPYWPDEKITSYARQVIDEADDVHARQRGIPFIGYFFGRTEGMNKDARRLEHELRTIFRATPSRSLSIFSLNDLLANPEAVAAMETVYREFGVIPDSHEP